jgi:glutaredoxin 3
VFNANYLMYFEVGVGEYWRQSAHMRTGSLIGFRVAVRCATLIEAVIRMYSTRFCGYCVAARRLLQKRGYSFDDIDVSRDSGLRERISRLAGNYRMVPMIFIGDDFVGGFDELAVLDRRGELAVRVGSATDRA